MTVEDIKELFMYGGGATFVIMTLVQVSPIKFNPWSWLARCIGRAINKEVLEKVESLSQDVIRNKQDDDEQWVSLSRSHILRFGDELRCGVNHSQEHFDQILLDISTYEHYCEAHPDYPNGKAIATIKLIKKTYQECLLKDNFL